MLQHVKLILVITAAVCLSLNVNLYAESDTTITIPTAKNGMVSSQEVIASQVGVDILKQGGNAVDAASR